ncbi:hypothetical protein GSI_05859 [Ganoderma sinense ZZ0214-1]|uniref:Fungal-type protein kinase domain-containing protein n=1 Tax=Ganoderma sinense ZZ0214-1 TaxID=1077348 RepID=A0A2G8SBP4_9APHY|nr:hypothetical protein GSI_05859 [Ganoderma sinense ZZ0214-1]
MSWWQLKVDDWFNTYLPGEGPPKNLRWTPFNVDLASERTMYAGLTEGLQNVIETAGCHDLEARSTYRYPDNTLSTTTGQTTRLCPDMGIYPVSRPDPDGQNSAATSVDPVELIRVRYNSMEVPVEVKHEPVKRAEASSTGTPATDSPAPSSSLPDPASLPSFPSPSETDFSISSPEGGAAVPMGLKAHCGQMMDYVIELFNRQHRLFVFMILFVNKNARLLRFDRTGASMTHEFDYTQHPEVIGKFLYHLSRSRDAMGHDPTASPANEADTTLFRALHAQYDLKSTVGRYLKDAATDGWPVYRLAIEGGFSSDEKSAVRREAPISRREFLIGRPMSVSRSLSGRGTKAHVAYDVVTKTVVVIKDSWRPNSDNIRSEYDTYLLLNNIDGEVINDIPTLLGGGDVVCQGVTQETQTPNPDLLTRIHFRLILKEVCRPLEDFVDSLELVSSISSALGAHFLAWTAAHVLHRDVSVGNILIFDQDPGNPPNPSTSRGLLADWDLAKTKDELDNPVFTQKTRSGTWPFISARLQHSGPEQRHELSDDLESFVHVLNYCALKHLPNTLSNDDVRIAKFISDVYDYVRESGGLDRGGYDKLDMLVNNKPFVQLLMAGHPLGTVLQMLSELCWQHYHHIQFRSRQSSLPPAGSREPIVFRPSPLERLRSVVNPSPTPEKILPMADPERSPFKDHGAIGNVFLWATMPPEPSKVKWPSDKIKRTKPLIVPLATSRSGKRQSGAPSYAPYSVEEPKHSAPAKRARSAATLNSRGSRGRSTRAKALKTSSRKRIRSETSPAEITDPMAMRSGAESSRSTTPESQGMLGDVEDDADMDDGLEPDAADSESDTRVAGSALSHHYAERVTDMASGLDDIRFD